MGAGTSVWHFSHVQSGARLGRGCSLGQNVNIGPDVSVGDRVKIQNNVSVYTGTTLEDDVFLGPSCVLTNVTNPRSQVAQSRTLRADARPPRRDRRRQRDRRVRRDAGPLLLRRRRRRRDARRARLRARRSARRRGTTGWMSRHGHRLRFAATGQATCPESGLRYALPRRWTSARLGAVPRPGRGRAAARVDAPRDGGLRQLQRGHGGWGMRDGEPSPVLPMPRAYPYPMIPILDLAPAARGALA